MSRQIDNPELLVEFAMTEFNLNKKDAEKKVKDFKRKTNFSEDELKYFETVKHKYLNEYVNCDMAEGGGWIMYVKDIKMTRPDEFLFLGPCFKFITPNTNLTTNFADSGYVFEQEGDAWFYYDYEINNYMEIISKTEAENILRSCVNFDLEMFDDNI